MCCPLDAEENAFETIFERIAFGDNCIYRLKWHTLCTFATGNYSSHSVERNR